VLELVDWPTFASRVGEEHAGTTREHVSRSISASIERARTLLGFAPRYTALEALREALDWLVVNGHVDVEPSKL
jgi:nucleoside-diphosphate-sugar epimerase